MTQNQNNIMNATKKYPNMMTLFKFCKNALNRKYQGYVRVIDQDIGTILDYDPADCSHWKKGRKNIRSLKLLRSLSDHLSLDYNLIISLAKGKLNYEEAIFELEGYFPFSLSQKQKESLKKDFFKDCTKWTGSNENIYAFEPLFTVNKEGISTVVKQIFNKISLQRAPVNIKEIYQQFSNISLIYDDSLKTDYDIREKKSTEKSKTPFSQTEFYYQKEPMKPYVRFIAIRTLYNHLMKNQDSILKPIKGYPDIIHNIYANIFTSMLLLPQDSVIKTAASPSSVNIIDSLSKKFLVSKTIANRRVKDIFGDSE